MALVVKNPHANAGDLREMSSIFESGKSPRGGQRQPTPVFLPGQSSLIGYGPLSCKESDTTEVT